MRHPDAGHISFADKRSQQMFDVLLGEVVEGRGGLIEQQDLGLVGKGAGDGDALGLAAGKGGDIAIFIASHADLGNQVSYLRIPQGNPVLCGSKDDVVGGGAGKQIGLLHDHADATAQGPRVHCAGIDALQQDGAAGGFIQPVQHAQQGAFAGSAGAEDGENLSLVETKADIAQQRFGAARLIERSGQIPGFQCGRICRQELTLLLLGPV